MKTIETMNKKSLTREVYYQCIWIIKDRPRLEFLVTALDCSRNAEAGEFILRADRYGGILREEVMEEAEFKLECIEKAIEAVPEDYRDGILANIVEMRAFGDEAHPNTWKRWKRVFIYELARRLRLY